MKKKGFTLIELLVVIAIIALLMGILMPALARVRLIAYRMVCGSNLRGIGNAIMLYAGDNEEEYPLPGIKRPAVYAQDGTTNDWSNANNFGPSVSPPGVYGQGPDCGKATIGSIFYLLVKYEDLSVKNFNCKGDVGVKPFNLTDWPVQPVLTDFARAYDFGPQPGAYNSYSYNIPFARNLTCGDGETPKSYQVNANSKSGSPVAADRNPTLDKNVDYILGGATGGGQLPPTAPEEEELPFGRWTESEPPGYRDPDRLYNAFAHQREGQNVLFNDGHVAFENSANVGVNDDNIWQKWTESPLPADTGTAQKIREVGGFFPEKPTAGSTDAYNTYTDIVRMGDDDALLIDDYQDSGGEG